MARPDDAEERQEDLAATSASLQEDADRVAQIEEEKQGLSIGDPRLEDLSVEAERIAGDLQRKSRVERDLSEGGEAGPTEPTSPPH